MTALIIDDEEQARETLAYYLREFFPEIEVVGKAANIIEGGRVFNEANPDLVFLDVSMPFGSGLELASQVDFSSTFVVFVTAHAEYALEAFKISAFDYLLKPVHITDLTRVINKARTANNARRTSQSSPKIMLKYSGKVLVLEQDDIVFIKSEGNYTNIWLTDGKKILISRNIKKVEEEYFSGFPFFRTHQSYIINLNKVVQYDNAEILLGQDILVPIAKLKFNQFRQSMARLGKQMP